MARDEHDGIPLSLWCRESLKQYLDTDELFEVTKQGFDWYHANFGMRYPFGKYDQLFVPEFNAGAMENAGCVTIAESYVFRGKVTDARRERRAETVLHEMAHMWFGDLVTMRWWDDLWLNESFATYASVLCQVAATRWTHAWTTFANTEKTWAYRQDQLPSTHPIATDAPDVQTAEVNFDGITYAKGASVLKQLGAYVGIDAFLAGLREYFVDHAYANTTLADLLAALEKSSGRQLGDWSKLWLETAGINTLRPDFTLADDGTFAEFAVAQSAPDDVAASNTLRPHRLAIGCYERQDGRLVRTNRIELDLEGARTSVPELVGVAQPDLLLVNDDDLTYCKMRLDERSIETLRTGGIAELDESLPRALLWSATWDMTRDGELPTRDYVALVLAGIDRETDIGVTQSLIGHTLRALEIYADPQWAPEGYRAMAERARASLASADPGSDHQLVWAHALLSSMSTSEDLAYARALLDGSEVVEGLEVDTELRWSILSSLAAHGAVGEHEIEAELERDPSAAGQRNAAIRARPAAHRRGESPGLAADPARRAAAERDDQGAHRRLRALDPGRAARPVRREVLRRDRRRLGRTLERGGAAHRRSGCSRPGRSTCTPETVAAADAFLAGDVPFALRRLISEGRADVVRSLRAREADRG